MGERVNMSRFSDSHQTNFESGWLLSKQPHEVDRIFLLAAMSKERKTRERESESEVSFFFFFFLCQFATRACSRRRFSTFLRRFALSGVYGKIVSLEAHTNLPSTTVHRCIRTDVLFIILTSGKKRELLFSRYCCIFFLPSLLGVALRRTAFISRDEWH